MLKGKTDREIIAALQNGSEETLLYLSAKYFQSSRRWMRRKGIPDHHTPEVFSSVLVRLYRDIQHRLINENVDLEKWIFNVINELADDKANQQAFKNSDRELGIVASCFSILDEQSRRILSARYSEKLSYEEMAGRFEFSNPVIAQFETEKAFSQLQQISSARLNPAITE